MDLIRDNPAGQDTEFTPFVLIREVKEGAEIPEEEISAAESAEPESPAVESVAAAEPVEPAGETEV